jgi:hypothetical protein
MAGVEHVGSDSAVGFGLGDQVKHPVVWRVMI